MRGGGSCSKYLVEKHAQVRSDMVDGHDQQQHATNRIETKITVRAHANVGLLRDPCA